MKKYMEYEVEGARPRARPKRTWREVMIFGELLYTTPLPLVARFVMLEQTYSLS